jgi:hypothetical protein
MHSIGNHFGTFVANFGSLLAYNNFSRFLSEEEGTVHQLVW